MSGSKKADCIQNLLDLGFSIALPPEIAPVFADYVERYNITDTLFPYTPRFIEVVLATTAKQARLQKKVTACILRDTFVVSSLKQGAKLENVLQKIGLSDSTWEDARRKYTKLAAEGIWRDPLYREGLHTHAQLSVSRR